MKQFAQPGKPIRASKAGTGLRWALLPYLSGTCRLPAQGGGSRLRPLLTHIGDSYDFS